MPLSLRATVEEDLMQVIGVLQQHTATTHCNNTLQRLSALKSEVSAPRSEGNGGRGFDASQ